MMSFDLVRCPYCYRYVFQYLVRLSDSQTTVFEQVCSPPRILLSMYIYLSISHRAGLQQRQSSGGNWTWSRNFATRINICTRALARILYWVLIGIFRRGRIGLSVVYQLVELLVSRLAEFLKKENIIISTKTRAERVSCEM
jgi:hypothetical protein